MGVSEEKTLKRCCKGPGTKGPGLSNVDIFAPSRPMPSKICKILACQTLDWEGPIEGLSSRGAFFTVMGTKKDLDFCSTHDSNLSQTLRTSSGLRPQNRNSIESITEGSYRPQKRLLWKPCSQFFFWGGRCHHLASRSVRMNAGFSCRETEDSLLGRSESKSIPPRPSELQRTSGIDISRQFPKRPTGGMLPRKDSDLRCTSSCRC